MDFCMTKLCPGYLFLRYKFIRLILIGWFVSVEICRRTSFRVRPQRACRRLLDFPKREGVTWYRPWQGDISTAREDTMLFLLVGVALCFPRNKFYTQWVYMSNNWFKFGVFYWNSSFVADCDDSAVIHCIFVLTSKPPPPPPPKKSNIPSKKKQKTYEFWVYKWPEFWNWFFWSFFLVFYGRSAVFSFPCPFRRLGGKSPFTFDADGSVTTTLWLGTEKGRCLGRDCQIHILYIYSMYMKIMYIYTYIYTHVSGPCKGCQIDGKGCH